MSDTTQAPEDFAAYQAWRRGESVPASDTESNPVTEAEPLAAETQPAQDDEPETENETEQQQDDADEANPKKKGGFQRRIDKLTREKRELEAQLQAARSGGESAAKPAQEQKAATSERPQPEQFDDYDKYVEALADWKTEAKIQAAIEHQRKAAEAREQQEREQSRAKSFQDRAKQAAEKYADFEAVAFSADVPVSEAMKEVLLDSEHGPELAYWLGKNPADAQRIAGLSPIAAARELGRIEATFAAAPKQQPKLTKAPDPIKPVTPQAKQTVNVSDEKFAGDYAAWERARMAQLRRR